MAFIDSNEFPDSDDMKRVWDEQRSQYVDAHPRGRMGKMPDADKKRPLLTGSVMCNRCGQFFMLLEGKDGRYGGIQQGEGDRRDQRAMGRFSLLCNDCLVDGLADKFRAWREIAIIISTEVGNA